MNPGAHGTVIYVILQWDDDATDNRLQIYLSVDGKNWNMTRGATHSPIPDGAIAGRPLFVWYGTCGSQSQLRVEWVRTFDHLTKTVGNRP
jgi:hypothetical protein